MALPCLSVVQNVNQPRYQHNCHASATLPPRSRHTTATQRPHFRHTTATLPPRFRHTSATLPPRFRHTSATQPPHYRPTSATLSPHYCRTALLTPRYRPTSATLSPHYCRINCLINVTLPLHDRHTHTHTSDICCCREGLKSMAGPFPKARMNQANSRYLLWSWAVALSGCKDDFILICELIDPPKKELHECLRAGTLKEKWPELIKGRPVEKARQMLFICLTSGDDSQRENIGNPKQSNVFVLITEQNR